VTKDGLTISSPNGLKLGSTIKLDGLPPGQVTVTAVILESPVFGPLQRAGSLSRETVAAAGRTVTFTTTVGPDGTIQIPASLQGVALASVSVVEGATTTTSPTGTTAPANNSGVAQQPAGSTPAQVPAKLPTGLPSTGEGGMAS